MNAPRFHILHFHSLRWEINQQNGFRTTSGKMFQRLSEHPLVSKIWYIQPDRRVGWTLRDEQINDKIHVIGLPNGIRGNRVPVLGQLNIARNASLLTRHLKLHRNDNDEVVYWFYDWNMAELLRKLPKETAVMELRDHMDDIYGINWSARRKLQKAKRYSLAMADLAFAVSPRLLPELAGCSGIVDVEYNAIGKDFLELARSAQPEPPVLRNIVRPRLGVVGANWSLNNRVDHELLAQVMELLPDWQLVLVGCDKPNSSLATLCQRPNVHLFGMQPQMTLPAIIQHFDVCSVPYRKGPVLRDALKIYEYVGCRKPTILTVDEPHPSLRPFTRTATDAESFAAACRELLHQKVDKAAIDSAMDSLTWESRADRCLKAISKQIASKPPH